MQSYTFLEKRLIRIILIIAFIALIIGCAGQKAFLKTAEIAAQSTNELKQATDNFFKQVDNLHNNGELRLGRIEKSTREISKDTEITTVAWEINQDTRAMTMFAALSKKEPNEIIEQSLALTSLQSTTETQKTNFNSIQYDNLVKRLNEIGNPSFSDSASPFIKIAKDIKANLDKDKKKATDGLKTKTNDSSLKADKELLKFLQ